MLFSCCSGEAKATMTLLVSLWYPGEVRLLQAGALGAIGRELFKRLPTLNALHRTDKLCHNTPLTMFELISLLSVVLIIGLEYPFVC